MRHVHLSNFTIVVVAVALALSPVRLCIADQSSIIIDGVFDDWIDIRPAYEDASGDGGGAGIDLGRMWISDDDRFLFLRFELGVDLDLSENNDLRIYLDTDADSGTGLPIAGIGAELEWRLGQRIGTFRYQGRSTTVYHDHLRFRGGPTVTAAVFEVAFGRDTLPDGSNPLFLGPQVRIVLRDEAGGDQLPQAGDILSYNLDEGKLPPQTPIPLTRQAASDLRVITYNVLGDSPWEPGEEPRFGRQFAAVAPDILNFQEIYDHSAAQTAVMVANWLPGPWFAAENADCKTISRYPILGTWPLDGNLAALIDTTIVLGTPLLIINAHLPCCANETGRQAEIDRIMAFIRDAQQLGGAIDLPPNTPILITGDLNLVGLAQQLTSLLTGDIVNETIFGPDFAPDWDGTDMANLISRQTEKRMGYTWRDDFSSFWPGHLDYFIYTDHVLEAANHFILYTPEMSHGSLDKFGLLRTDSLASDHILVCADFRPPAPCPGDFDNSGDVGVKDLLFLLGSWGPCPPKGDCPADFDNTSDVGVKDLLFLLGNWGPCP